MITAALAGTLAILVIVALTVLEVCREIRDAGRIDYE